MAGMLTSKLTDRCQTTLPSGVRAVLGLEPGERIGYVIEGDEVRLVNASARDHRDPVLEGFLSFLAADMADNPDRLVSFSEELLIRARELTGGIAIDHDAPIDDVTAL